MLAPMTLARPKRWWYFATISLAGSLAGSVIGYELGHYAFHYLQPFLADIGWSQHLDAMVEKFGAAARQHPWEAFWMLVAAGFLPIPMKVASWACGIVGMPILPFLAGILIGRGKRVFLVAGVIRLGGERAERSLHKHIETAGWLVVAIIVVLGVYFYLR
jgi:membrane protein YqaA with SNARE-associated domain